MVTVMTEIVLERPLQVWENICAWGQQKEGDVSVLPTCELELTKRLNIDLMKSAVNDIIARHANLRAVILDKENISAQGIEKREPIPKEKRFSLCILDSSFALKKFNFFEHIQLGENEKWDFSMAETQMRRNPGLGSDKQQFRVVLVTSPSAVQKDEMMVGEATSLLNPTTAYMMLYYNHAICDGRGGYIVLNDILTRYTELCCNNDKHHKPTTNKIYDIVPTIMELRNKNKICRSAGGNLSNDSQKVKQDNKVNDLIAELNRRLETNQKCIPAKTCLPGGVVRNGCIFVKGTMDGLAKMKAWCKQEKITVGMATLAAVYWALAQFSDEVPSVDIDVDLRRRFGGPKEENVEIPPQVALLIGMCSIHRAAKIDEKGEEFKSYARRLQNELMRTLEDEEHFYSHDVVLQRWLDDIHDHKDMNFSNIGLYPFPTKFDVSGLEIKGYWTPGNGWCPEVCEMAFLLNTIPGVGHCYTMVFEDFEDNRQLANRILESIRNVCEQEAFV